MHCSAAMCTSGHAARYCSVCDGFFEHVLDEVASGSAGGRKRGGVHHRGHPVRKNLSNRQLRAGECGVRAPSVSLRTACSRAAIIRNTCVWCPAAPFAVHIQQLDGPQIIGEHVSYALWFHERA
jgi:hypothetical protein